MRDSEDGAVTEVRGHVVVNATGVWTDEIQALSKQRGRFQVRASKGVHIVVPRDRIVSDVAIILRAEKSVMFVIPWGNHWIIGTTDTDWALDLAHPAATKADIDYILGTVNTVLATPLAVRAAKPVRTGQTGPALIPVLRDTGLTMLLWSIAVAAALALTA